MDRESMGFRRGLESMVSRAVEWGVVGLLFLAPLWMFPLSFSPASAKSAFITAAILLLLALSAWTSWAKREITVRLPWIFPAAALLTIASALSLIGAANRGFAVGSLVLLCLYLSFGLLITHLSGKEATARRMLSVLVAAGAVSTLVGILQYLGVLGDLQLPSIDRITGTFGNRNFLGSFLGVMAFPAASLLFAGRRRFAWFAAWLGIAVCFFGPALVQQTGVLLALMAGALFWVAGIFVFGLRRYVRKNWRTVLALVAAALVGAGTGLALWYARPLEPIQRTSGDLITDMWTSNYGPVREVDWGTAWEMFAGNPLTGVGLGNYKVEFLQYKSRFLSGPLGDRYVRTVSRAAHAHNDLLQAMAELGIPGAVAILAMLAVAIWSFWVRCRSACPGERQMELLLLTSGLVVVAAHAMVSFPLHLPATALSVIVILGLMSSARYGDRAVLERRLSGRIAQILALSAFAILCLIGAVLGREILAQVSYSQGISKMDAGDFEQAYRLFEQSAATSLCVTEADFRLANVALLRSDEARQQGNLAAASSLLQLARHHAQQWYEAYPTESGMLLLAGIAVLQRESEFPGQILKLLLDSRPHRVFETDARYLLAVLAMQDGYLQESQMTLRALIEEFPTHVQSYILLGRLLTQEGSLDDAFRILDQGLQVASAEIARVELLIRTADRLTRQDLESDRQRLLLEQQTLASLLEGL